MRQQVARCKSHHTALRDGRPQFRLPHSHSDLHIVHPGSNAAAVTPR